MPSPFEMGGSRPLKQDARFAPIFINRPYGIFTNRNPLRDPSDTITELFYKGKPGALIDGLNIELDNKLRLSRRPGLNAFSTATYPTPPDSFYAFKKISGTIDVIVDTTDVIYVDNQDGTKSTIFTKSAGAGQATFLGIGDTLYFGDGVDQEKWDGTNTWAWGSPGPTDAPTVIETPSGASAVLWQPNTVWATMGFIVVTIGGTDYIMQMTSVNATGTNSTQFGTTGNGNPAWDQTLGGTTTDNTITWENRGPVGTWKAGQVYSNFSVGGTTAQPCVIYDPVTKALYGNTNPALGSGTSGASKPHFTGVNGSTVTDNTGHGGITWFCINPPPGVWQPSHAYQQIGSISNNDVNCSIVEPIPLPVSDSQETTWQVVTTAGTSGTGGTQPPWPDPPSPGDQTVDNDIIWTCQGPAARTILTAYNSWGGPGQLLFGCFEDPNGNMQVCIQSGTTSATATASITWATGYGDQTDDGTVIWACVGPSMGWTANTIWYLPMVGFYPPQTTSSYGGAAIKDTNSNVEFVISSGLGGAVQPTWGAIGTNTTDNDAVWYADAPFSANSLAWQIGYGYVFAGKARTLADPYNTTPPPGQANALGPPTGSKSGLITNASPAFLMPDGPNPGSINTISGLGFTDPQIDTIVIFRSADGDQAGPYLFLTEIPNPAPIGGIAQPWSFDDFLSDDELNPLIQAAIAGENTPPPAGAINPVLHFGRVWVSVGPYIYASAGGDAVPFGTNGAEAFPPGANVFTFPSTVTRMVSTASGLIVFTTADVYGIFGGPGITQFYAQPLIQGTGLLSYNALDVRAGIIYLFTADRQLKSLDPQQGELVIGFPIADLLESFDPATAYVAFHQSGNDSGLYIADGSTGWYRMNPNQVPDGGQVFSPKATIAAGVKAIASIEVTKGVHRLLVGPTGNNQSISKRDVAVFSDNGSPYAAFFTIGSLILAEPGQMAELGFMTFDFMKVGTQPTPSFLLSEISGSFTPLTLSVQDPPSIFGVSGAPNTLYSPRFYFSQTQQAMWCRHMQFKVTFSPTDTVQNAMLTATLFGAIYKEK